MDAYNGTMRLGSGSALGLGGKLGAVATHAIRIDHIAVAVSDLDTSVRWYRDVLGFQVVQERDTRGEMTGMVSAVLEAGPITFVLVQGTSPESQVSRFIARYGNSVQHVAIAVRDLEGLRHKLLASGAAFNTTIIEGKGIRQMFTRRDPGSGQMIEFIERLADDGDFTDESVHELFAQLEKNDAY
jgi:4-hydroxyphenylpyruvate dioxygenase-like putative hemolysin